MVVAGPRPHAPAAGGTSPHVGRVLPFGGLGALPGLLQSVFLALLHTRVTRQKARLLERRTEVGVELDECTRDAGRDRSRLAARPTTDHLDADVELALSARDPQRSQCRHLEDAAAEIGQRVLVIDGDPALTRLNPHPRDRVLAPAGASVERLSQS